MNQEVKKEWVAALRSGHYEQGRHSLRIGNKFCCLGVLCDISGQAKWRKPHDDGTMFAYIDQMASLPEEVLNWSGFLAGRQNRLMDLNDAGVSFAKIADYIERNL